MLKCAGRFCFYGYMATRIPFIKTYSTPHELVQLLKTRGMEITDEEKAQHYLSHIGYYRLSAYMYPLLSIPKEQHLFKQGVTFGKVMMLYRFDKKLRLLLFNEIEKIEVAVRCAIGCSIFLYCIKPICQRWKPLAWVVSSREQIRGGTSNMGNGNGKSRNRIPGFAVKGMAG